MDLRTLVRTSVWMNFLVSIGDFSFIGSPINAKLKDSVKLGVLFMAQWAFLLITIIYVRVPSLLVLKSGNGKLGFLQFQINFNKMFKMGILLV